MAVVNYQRILDGTSLTGRFGESMNATEKWQIRVDSPTTSKLEILTEMAVNSGVTWGASHWEFSALRAMEFELSPESKDGMRWILVVKYYIPPRAPTANGLPEDVWERVGGVTTVPAFEDIDGEMIVNSAGDPLEGIERERDETSWTLVKCYETEAEASTAITDYAGAINETYWAGKDAKEWKCFFKGAKAVSISKLDGNDDAGLMSYVETRWEFRHDPETWTCKPWDIGFMELVSGERRIIKDAQGNQVKQPVALQSSGAKKTAGQPPSVINGGDGVEIYRSADWSSEFGTPYYLPSE